MLTHFGVDSLQAEWPEAVVCVGTFDGVHLGHQALLTAAAERAELEEIPSVVVTFDRHPAATLAPDRCPQPIAPLQENLAMIAAQGISATVILHFDNELAQTSAESFLKSILVDKIHASEAFVGHDFAFGHGREGTPQWLNERLPTTVFPPFEIRGTRVSSRAIRGLIAEGAMESATELLGRPFRIDGVVIHGQKLGRTIGFPTLNLARSTTTILPPDGVYSGSCETVLGRFRAAVSIGERPTIEGAGRSIEAYLLDYPGDELYSHSVSLDLNSRIRPELKFANVEELAEQIAADIASIRQSAP